jgi:hypothetical protein
MRSSEFVSESWSEKYKRSINCAQPKGFSQKAHCAGRKKNEDLTEFAPASNPGGGNYLKALASAWYNGTFNTGDLHKGIKSQEDVERILERGIHCGDGRVRKYNIGYNDDFDGVLITSDDYYNYSDYDDAGRDIDSRTGKPWGPYEYVEFGGNELDESAEPGVAEGYEPPTSAKGSAAYRASLLRKKQERQAAADAKKKEQGVAEGEVVAFPKKHRGDISDMHSCPKCGGDLQGGKYMGHAVQVCMPCKQVYLPPNSGIDQQGNKISRDQLTELSFLGSQCTKDCSGHRAGYEWSQRKGGTDAASQSPSFNKGAWLHNNGY